MTRSIVALCLALAAHTAAGATHTVTMDGTAFSPETLTVKRGDRVVWVNKDPFPHTATATSKAFDSKGIAPGKSWRARWPLSPALTFSHARL